MPYLDEQSKSLLKPLTSAINETPAFNAGELNYLFTMLSKRYLEQHGESYQRYNDLLGALEGCKLELYRRKVSIYEQEKIKINGDVF